MTLYTFGGNPSAVLTDAAGEVIPGYPVNVRRAGTGESVTAIFEADGITPIGQLTTNAAGHSMPGAIRTFTVADVRAIEYQYLDAGGNPVRWYEAARELAPAALDTANGAATVSEAAQVEAAAALAAAAAAQNTADDALSRAGLAGWFVVTGATRNGSTDDAAAIQGALDNAAAAGGGTVLIPAGSYAVASALVAYDNTVIYAYGATLTAIGDTGLLHNYASTSEVFSGYNGRSHITVLGGIWDGNAGTGPGQTSGEHDVISFNHCRDITLRDVVVRNTPTAHALEFNSCDGGRAVNCRFEGFADLSPTSNRQFSEAVQIDIAVNGSSAVGAFDGTPSRNIEISGCYSGPSDRLGVFGRFVGSHTAAAGTYYDNIVIRGNTVEGTIQEGVYGYGWRRAIIADNIIKNTGRAGIVLTVPNPASAGYSLTPDQALISGNTVSAAGADSGIRVIGYASAVHTGVRITGNTVNGGSVGGANGLQVEYCAGPGLVANTVANSPTAAIFVNNCTDALVSGCTVTSAGSNAINATASPGTIISGNTINGVASNYGIFVLSSDSCSITGNRVAAAASAGIRLSTSTTRAIVASNQVRKGSGATAAGISLDATAAGALLMGNDLSGNGWSAATALAVSTAAPTTGPGGMTALPGSNLVDSDLTALPALEAAMRPAGRYETTTRLRCGSATTPTSGTLYLVPIWLPAGLSVSAIAFVSGTTAAAGLTACWYSLHDSNRVAVARTADQGAAAWAANTVKSLAIAQSTAGTASSYTTTYTGLHYLGVMIAGTTLPNLIGEGAVSAVSGTSPGLGPTNTGQSSPPTVTAGAFTAAAFSGGSAPLSYAYVA